MEPNYTQIPNVIFDYWMSKLSETQFKVLLCICRKTFGWQKIRDAISLNQMEKMTGLSRNSVVNSLKKLAFLKLVTITKNKTTYGDDDTNQYALNIQSMGSAPNELPSAPNEPPSARNELGVVHEMNQGVVHEMNTQKKDYTKERHTKEKSADALSGAEAPSLNSFSNQSNLDDENCIAHANCQHCGSENWFAKKGSNLEDLQHKFYYQEGALPSGELHAINVPEGCRLNKQNQIVADQKKKEKPKDKACSEEAKALGDSLIEEIKKRKPDFKAVKKLPPFYRSVDKMINDGREANKILSLFCWAIDNNWRGSRLYSSNPAEFLYKHFDELEADRVNPAKGNFKKSINTINNKNYCDRRRDTNGNIIQQKKSVW